METGTPSRDRRDAWLQAPPPDYFLRAVTDRNEQARYRTLRRTLEPLRELFEDRRVLDFGASHGPGICALLELGAREVVGVEPNRFWVDSGLDLLAGSPYATRASLQHVPDTRSLPFESEHFDVVLVNAVLEHIPQPRDPYLREIWRVLAPGGYLIVNETPNKYYPREVHTTHLWFIHWLPSRIARGIAIRRGRFNEKADWASSGWRGLGYLELVKPLRPNYELIPEELRPRHRLLTRWGIPASILDPYPTWILRRRG
jgi:SAM-dependent methyltransferase